MLVAVILGVSAWQHHGLRIELEKQIKLEDSSAISQKEKNIMTKNAYAPRLTTD